MSNSLIDSGDLVLQDGANSKQDRLFHAIRDKIVQQLWPKSARLPSTRALAQHLAVSRNTVIATYEQLVAEGYLESKVGSGFYVAVALPQHYFNAQVEKQYVATSHSTSTLDINTAFAPGVPDLVQFPIKLWQKCLQHHGSRSVLLGSQCLQGDKDLRAALSDYLASSRSVHCDPERVIITNGAQQAIVIALMCVLKANDSILMEQPGYAQLNKVVNFFGYQQQGLKVSPYQGVDMSQLLSSDAQAVYMTPSNQYPMGTSLNTEQRLKIIDWASTHSRWVIEDDYDSEFQFAHRPYSSMQGLAGQMGISRILYIGSFSKVMFNSLRLGYLVVPKALVATALAAKDALSGELPSYNQAALAEFINEGHLLRHIHKMRRLYKLKHQAMLQAIAVHFANKIEVVSQAAGLHVTLKWQQGIDEQTWTQRAKAAGIIIRPLSYYERSEYTKKRGWHGAVLGFGNIALAQIDSKIEQLAALFLRLEAAT
ncbi:PLP-dependent aminotransferase family protein [Motilimonas sp. 1_MG-2023]|uniref:MocR-like pyridoxine biosynthesis transcription factor PdxR n=1 Tax=Motilimonas sp. 1_MG-2023 TaxID=3062672 RepID=UPI0026E26D85|nr:PLP-dependent aminotransferase family protein [Motilimonas sp. 1_MG-2023]MDO6524531.1 PLP-dependent aminotransferase family protein [Motilimonas sp. 1_MG-2023]